MTLLAIAVLAVLSLSLVELSKAARWQALFGPYRPPYVHCLRALVAGQLTNALSPVRAGEAVRLGLIAARGVPLVPSVAALAGAKALDTVCLGAIAAAVLGAAVLEHAGVGFAAGGLVVAMGLGVMAWGSGARALLGRLPFERRLRLSALVDVAENMKEPRVLIVVAVATLLVWTAGAMANVFVLAAVGLAPTLDLAARVLVAGYVVGFVPSPPARLGVFEAGVTAALVSGGVDIAAAIPAAVLLHVCSFTELGILVTSSLLVSRRWSPTSG